MPKQRITRETVIAAAFEIARASGMEQVLVKNIADKIGCSVQPIYSYCKNMDGLRQDITQQACVFIRDFVAQHLDPKDLFRSTGQAYLQLAKEEPHLFKLFVLHERRGISSLEDLYEAEASPQMPQAIAESLNISISQAKQLHLHMLIYTIGIGTIFSVTTPGISAEEIYTQQELAYEVFLQWVLSNEGPKS
ncbi:MAG: TetR/AcrR family transcriptional regulator [Lachnospiraceae bacterium]|jgi:AcrR family transcriptional regulator|nr:TetR/AcrR family transcriptional regulator [Lachnospiraceae bacterium]